VSIGVGVSQHVARGWERACIRLRGASALRCTQRDQTRYKMDHTCANCGIRIRWRPTVVDGQTYCCLGCAMGGPCSCDYSNLPQLGEFRALSCSYRVIILPAASDESEGPEPGQPELKGSQSIPPQRWDGRGD